MLRNNGITTNVKFINRFILRLLQPWINKTVYCTRKWKAVMLTQLLLHTPASKGNYSTQSQFNNSIWASAKRKSHEIQIGTLHDSMYCMPYEHAFWKKSQGRIQTSTTIYSYISSHNIFYFMYEWFGHVASIQLQIMHYGKLELWQWAYVHLNELHWGYVFGESWNWKPWCWESGWYIYIQ